MESTEKSSLSKEPGEFVETVEQSPLLKLDKNGIPLSPQPSDDPADPLNWPLRLKVNAMINRRVNLLIDVYLRWLFCFKCHFLHL